MIEAGDEVAQFVSERLRFGLCPPYVAMGIRKGGEIIGGVVFNCFEGADVHVSVAGCGWTRTFLREVGRYVFNTLGCERMTAVTESEDIAKFAMRLGGKHEGILRNHFGRDRDGYICGILRGEYRY